MKVVVSWFLLFLLFLLFAVVPFGAAVVMVACTVGQAQAQSVKEHSCNASYWSLQMLNDTIKNFNTASHFCNRSRCPCKLSSGWTTAKLVTRLAGYPEETKLAISSSTRTPADAMTVHLPKARGGAIVVELRDWHFDVEVNLQNITNACRQLYGLEIEWLANGSSIHTLFSTPCIQPTTQSQGEQSKQQMSFTKKSSPFWRCV